MNILFEDNHIIIVSKRAGEIVQGDKTGDTPLSETVKSYIKERYQKPGNVFLGVVHRLDRPVSGVTLFARTSKALTRLSEMFRTRDVHKTYWAIVCNQPPKEEDTLTHWLTRDEKATRQRHTTEKYPNRNKPFSTIASLRTANATGYWKSTYIRVGIIKFAVS